MSSSFMSDDSDSSFDSVLDDSVLNSDSSADEEQEDRGLLRRRQQLSAVLLMRVILQDQTSIRHEKWNSYRIVWNKYLQQMHHQNEFCETFRMSLPTFEKLVALVRKDLLVDELQAYRSCKGFGSCYPEMIVAFSLRWLSGGQWQDLKIVYGISRTYLLVLVKKFIRAVLACEELAMKLPDNNNNMDKLKKSWFTVVIGGLDQLLVDYWKHVE